MSSSEWNRVLDYWFGGGDVSKRPKWFGGGEAAAQEIREQFEDLVEKARTDKLTSWEDDPKATLALIILQDQFCRSLYKGTPDSVSRDPYCVKLSKKFLEPGGTHSHLTFSPAGRFFIYLPLEHSESRENQALCVELYEKLRQDTKGTNNEPMGNQGLEYAIKHKEIIDKFGRFLQRNDFLGRESTQEEEEWLANPPPGYQW